MVPEVFFHRPQLWKQISIILQRSCRLVWTICETVLPCWPIITTEYQAKQPRHLVGTFTDWDYPTGSILAHREITILWELWSYGFGIGWKILRSLSRSLKDVEKHHNCYVGEHWYYLYVCKNIYTFKCTGIRSLITKFLQNLIAGKCTWYNWNRKIDSNLSRQLFFIDAANHARQFICEMGMITVTVLLSTRITACGFGSDGSFCCATATHALTRLNRSHKPWCVYLAGQLL